MARRTAGAFFQGYDLAQIAEGFGVHVEKVPTDGADCPIDHTAATHLATAEGECAGTIDHHEADTVAPEKLQHLIG